MKKGSFICLCLNIFCHESLVQVPKIPKLKVEMSEAKGIIYNLNHSSPLNHRSALSSLKLSVGLLQAFAHILDDRSGTVAGLDHMKMFIFLSLLSLLKPSTAWC